MSAGARNAGERGVDAGRGGRGIVCPRKTDVRNFLDEKRPGSGKTIFEMPIVREDFTAIAIQSFEPFMSIYKTKEKREKSSKVRRFDGRIMIFSSSNNKYIRILEII